MKGRILIIFLFVVALSFKAGAQVKLMDIKQLQKRIANTDTMYVVNFWATWCGPCVAELPNFVKLQKTYANKPLKVLLLSMDFKSRLQTEVIPFVNKHHFGAEVYLASRKNDQEWIDQIDKNWSGALPATLVVNNKKAFRQFFEKELSFAELNKIYQTNK